MPRGREATRFVAGQLASRPEEGALAFSDARRDLGAALVLIAEMQTPFSGSVRVAPFGFEQPVRLDETARLR